MFEIIRKVLPYLLVLYLFIRANKEPLFLLGIPFLIFMSNSIFFENAKLFTKPGSIIEHLIFIWLLVLWVFTKFISKNKPLHSRKKTSTLIDLGIVFLIIISVIGLINTYIHYSPLTDNLVSTFMLLMSLFLGYFIIKDWFIANNPSTVVDFLFILVCINTVASILFILHQGLHFNVYLYKEYLTESVQGQEITRSFWFMPQFLPFSIVFLLVFRKRNPLIFTLLFLVNSLAVLITYNVSTVIIAISMVIVYFILTGVKNNQFGLALKRMIMVAGAGLLFFLMMWKVLPANTNYLISRFSKLSESSYTIKEPNTLEVRFMYTKAVLSKIDKYKIIFGMGPVTDIQISGVSEMKGATSDMVWVGIIYRWGILGLIIFILIYIFSLFKSYYLYMKSENIISDFALLIFLYTISQILEGFVSWTFLSGHGYAIGLWYLSLLSAMIFYNKSFNKQFQKKMADSLT